MSVAGTRFPDFSKGRGQEFSHPDFSEKCVIGMRFLISAKVRGQEYIHPNFSKTGA